MTEVPEAEAKPVQAAVAQTQAVGKIPSPKREVSLADLSN